MDEKRAQRDLERLRGIRLHRARHDVWPHETVVLNNAQVNTLTKDTWHHFVIKRVWSSSNTGETTLWVDGAKVYTRTGYETYWCGTTPADIYWKIGQYSNYQMDKPYRLQFADIAVSDQCAQVWTTGGTACP